MKNRILLPLALIALVIAGCQKEDSGDNNGPSARMKLITSAPWVYDNAGIDMNADNIGETPIPPGTLNDCDLDNEVTLKMDSTGTVDEGATKCDAGDPQTFSLTWSFKDNETVVNIPEGAFGPLSGDATILELTETKLKLKKIIHIDVPISMDVTAIVDLKHP